ncbi:MAG: hypothetical protein ACREMS_02595 [Gemmatimonadaceae bacterium]
MTNTRRFVLVLIGWTLTSACSTDRNITGPSRDDSPVQTDAVTYRLERLPSAYRAYVTATFVNRSASPVYFGRCNPQSTGPMYGLRRTGADSTAALFYDWAWACVGSVPAGEIPVGGSVTVRVPVGSVDQPSMQPPLRPEELVGLMRVELSLCKDYSDSGDCVPLAQNLSSSNAFLVTY